jgi:hypothetical protein
MSDLRDTANRIAGMGRFPAPPPDRKLAIERAADRLAEKPLGNVREAEPWDDFLRRIGVI